MPSIEELAADAAEGTTDATLGLEVLIEKLAELKAQSDAAEAHAADVKREYNELRKKYLPRLLGERGLKTVRSKLGTLSITHKKYASVPAANREECRRWLIDSDYAHLLTLEPAAALELANVFLAGGDPIPGFIKLFTEETAVLTKRSEKV